MILFGLVDFCRVFFVATTVADSARAGAQYGAQSNALTGDLVGINAASQQDGADLPGTLTVAPERFCSCENGADVDCVTGTCSEGAPRIYVRVRSQYDFSTVTQFPGIPAGIDLDEVVTIRVQ